MYNFLSFCATGSLGWMVSTSIRDISAAATSADGNNDATSTTASRASHAAGRDDVSTATTTAEARNAGNAGKEYAGEHDAKYGNHFIWHRTDASAAATLWNDDVFSFG